MNFKTKIIKFDPQLFEKVSDLKFAKEMFKILQDLGFKFKKEKIF